jgi:hypothetical protein
LSNSRKPSRNQAQRIAFACLALAVLSFVFYARSLSFGFVAFDDTSIVLAHPNLYDEGSFGSSLYEIFLGYFPREEPLLLRDVSWALDARLFGFQNPFGYHLGNALFNALNVVLLFLFLHHATARFALALSLAGVFAILPVHAEPVCWIMGRKDVLVAFWLLLALLAQSYELAQVDPRRRRTLYLVTLLCTALALLSKLSAVSFFLVLGLHRALHPYLDGRRRPREPFEVKKSLYQVVPRVAPHAVLSVLYFAWYRAILEKFGVIGWRGPGPLDPEHLWNVAQFTPLVIGQYLKHLVWPTELSMFYRWPHVEIPLTTGQMLGSAGIAIFLLAATLYCCFRRRDLAFYLLTFFALLLPHLNFVYVGFWMADRYIYLASFCPLAIAGILLRELYLRAGAARPAVVALAVIFTFGSGVQAWRQQEVWRDSESLWLHEAYLDQPSLLSLQALAKVYVGRAGGEIDPKLRRRSIEKARVEIKRGLARDRELGRRKGNYKAPDQLHLSRLHYLQARILEIEGAPPEQLIDHYQKAFAIAPDRLSAMMLSRAYFNLAGRAKESNSKDLVKQSFAYFVEFLRMSPTDPVMVAKSREMLRVNYEGRFPFLEGAILEIKRTYLQ